MDRILFVPSVARSEWLHEMLPNMSQVMLPVAGRSFLDYALECAQKFNFKSAGILDWYHAEPNSEDRSGLSNKGITCIWQKAAGRVPRGLDDLENVASPYTNPVRDGLVVVWGLCLNCHRLEDVKLEPVAAKDCEDTPVGLYCREEGRWMRIRPGLAVNDVRSWYRLNSAILENSWLFTLPGYSSEANVHLGRNVVLEHGTRVRPPVVLQDNTWCARNVSLDGGVVIGHGVFVGEGTHIARSIIGDNTYVGVGLELEDKIVVGNVIMDTTNEAWTDIDEPWLLRSIGKTDHGWLYWLWNFLHGTSRGRRD